MAALGQNAANVTPAIPLGILLANMEGEEAPPPQEGRDATASEARTETNVRRRRVWCRRCNTMLEMHENWEVTIVSRGIEHTWDSMFNRLKRTIADPNLDDKYDSDYERLVGSRESPDLRSQLDAWRAQREQQAESRPPVRATLEEEWLSQMQAQIDRLLDKKSIPDPVQEVLSET